MRSHGSPHRSAPHPGGLARLEPFCAQLGFLPPEAEPGAQLLEVKPEAGPHKPGVRESGPGPWGRAPSPGTWCSSDPPSIHS